MIRPRLQCVASCLLSVALGLSALTAAFTLAPAAHAQADKYKPLTVDQTVGLLQGGLTSTRIVALVYDRGVDYTLTGAIQSRLTDAGADSAVLTAIRGNYRSTHRETTNDTGLSLADTLKFVQTQMNQYNTVDEVDHVHDSSTNQDWTNHFILQMTETAVDPETCHLGYHWKETLNGKVDKDDDTVGFYFKDVVDIVVWTGSQDTNKADADAGHPTWTVNTSPTYYAVIVRRSDGKNNELYFYDQSIANRVAANLAHATLLCGGSVATPQGATNAPAGQLPPTLADALKFVQDRMQSTVDEVDHVHDSATGRDWTNHFILKVSEPNVDPSTCHLGYHWTETLNDKVDKDDNSVGFYFKDVKEVIVTTGADDTNQTDAAAGHPTWSVTTTPAYYAVIVKRNDNRTNELYFYDQELANRLARALNFATKLCGGAAGQPF